MAESTVWWLLAGVAVAAELVTGTFYLLMIALGLASGALVEPLPHTRLDSPLVYWLIVAPRSAQRPEVKAFCDWLLLQAAATREAIGDVPDPDTIDQMD